MEVSIHYIIYEVRNKVNSKTYIGKHQTTNLDDDYLGSGKLIKEAIDKYGRENFEKKILFVFETEDEMNSKETELVTKEFVARDDNYNLCPGGKGGWGYVNQNMTPEERSRISSLGGPKTKEGFERHRLGAKRGGKYKRSEETKKKNYLASLGKKHDLEIRRKISEISKSRGLQKGEKNSQFGKPRSEETKRKIRETLKLRRGGRVDDCTRLESERTERFREFESPSLRH